jgi:hypothetical protein
MIDTGHLLEGEKARIVSEYIDVIKYNVVILDVDGALSKRELSPLKEAGLWF